MSVVMRREYIRVFTASVVEIKKKKVIWPGLVSWQKTCMKDIGIDILPG